MNTYDVIIILSAWYLKAFSDAIKFAKPMIPCYEIWHITDWIRSWMVPAWLAYRVKMPVHCIVIVVILSLLFNVLYCYFRFLNVYRYDNQFRIPWLSKILGRGGII